MKPILKMLFCFSVIYFFSANISIAQKEKDLKKENDKSIEKPGKNYTYTSGRTKYNPKTGKYEHIDGEWKKQPEEYQYDPKEWGKPKHKKAIYGKNPLRRLFKIKPKAKGDNPETTPSDKKDAPFTTGEEKEEK